MKALSIKDPWASMILRGEKTIETRTWRTKYRGRLLLCATQKPESAISGKAFAIANLVDCVPMTEGHVPLACCEVDSGLWAWILSDVTPLTEPLPVKGQQGLFNVAIKIGDDEPDSR